jgi:hypothetical protein
LDIHIERERERKMMPCIIFDKLACATLLIDIFESLIVTLKTVSLWCGTFTRDVFSHHHSLYCRTTIHRIEQKITE